MKYITKTIWLLSVVSLLTDAASEMLYPVMPVYLKSIGFSFLLIGILEGIAEATAGLSKGYFGKLSDHSGRRAPFVQIGYSLSAIAKPMMALFAYPLWVFFARTLDRLGKGIRTGARDAILSDEANPSTKGKVFGFHRSMDTIGAVIGPTLALLYLYFFPGDYITLFYIAFIPGVAAIFTTLYVRDKTKVRARTKTPTPFFSFIKYWKVAPAGYRKLIIGLLIFALFNSSDIFLLLKLKESGVSDSMAIGAYIFYNLVYAAFAFPAGILADKIGLKKIFITGLVLFTVVYCGMALTGNLYFYLFLFLLYGLYAASTEGIAKAWISNISDKRDTATAIGFYAGFQSICAFVASSATGLIWFEFGAAAAFMVTAIITALLTFYFVFIIPRPVAAS